MCSCVLVAFVEGILSIVRHFLLPNFRLLRSALTRRLFALTRTMDSVTLNEAAPKKKATLGCKDEATMAACSQLGTLKSGVLLRARKALVAAQAEDSQRFTAPAPILESLLPLLHALGVVADDNDSHKTGASTETVALTGSLDQVLACVDEAREARAAAFNDELSSELKTLGLPELTQSLLSISPAEEEDDGKCAFLPASELYRTGTGTAQAKNGRAWDETTQATKKHGRRS